MPLAVNAPQTRYEPNLGQTLTIQCVVTSGTATGITWFKNSNVVVLSGNNRLTGASPSSPSLVITGVQNGDAGTYVCQATDGTTTVQTDQITVYGMYGFYERTTLLKFKCWWEKRAKE